MKFAILDQQNIVINHAVADSALTDAWIPAGDSKRGDEWTGSEFIKPLAALQAMQAKKAQQIDRQYTAAMNAIRADYHEDEIKSWDQQKAEAAAYTADNNAAVPLLDAMLVGKGIDISIAAARETALDALTGKINTNAAAYAEAYGQALGLKQSRMEALNAIDLEAADAAAQIEAI